MYLLGLMHKIRFSWLGIISKSNSNIENNAKSCILENSLNHFWFHPISILEWLFYLSQHFGILLNYSFSCHFTINWKYFDMVSYERHLLRGRAKWQSFELKFSFSEKATKFLKNFPLNIWRYWVTSNYKWKIFFQICALLKTFIQ